MDNDVISQPESDIPVGVLVVFEAENLKALSFSMPDVHAQISKTLKKLGLTELSITKNEVFDENVFVITMKEGYLVVRIFPEHKFIAFDLVLWDGLNQVDSVKEALTLAVGGSIQDSSSFRFVTGGISALESCEKNVLTQVAVETRDSLCKGVNSDAHAAEPENVKKKSIATILETLIGSLSPFAIKEHSILPVIAVLCGDKASACSSLDDLQKMDSIQAQVIPIYACNIPDKNISACETQMKESLQSVVSLYKKLDVVILDAKLPFVIGQIVEKLFRDKVYYSKIMEESQLILSPVPFGELWRNVLVDRFRTDFLLFDPAHRAILRFYNVDPNDTASYLEWCLFSSADQEFFSHLSTAIARIESKTDMKVEVEDVANGIINQIIDFSPSKVTKDSDYDRTRAALQWSTQSPVGHQTIFQMKLQPPKTPLELGEEILAEIEPGPWDMQYANAVVMRVFEDDTYAVQYYRSATVHVIGRDQIRKFSAADMDLSTSFEVGDLIFWENEYGVFQNGVISSKEVDGTYDIYLLNTSGNKVYGVPRSSLIYQFESADFVEEIPDLDIPELLGAFGYGLKNGVLAEGEEMSLMDTIPVGSGVIIPAIWKNGHAILQWDGIKRVDVNLFTYEEDKESRFDFQNEFCGQFDYLVGVSRDEHPRGYGKIVNFGSEIAAPPQWIRKQKS
jgi:hypothetical protein